MLGELVPWELGDRIPLLNPRMMVGRKADCDIVLDFPNISARHCLLEILDGHWHVRDLNTRNGIKVNGRRCASAVLLPGDEISIAKHWYKVNYLPFASGPRFS